MALKSILLVSNESFDLKFLKKRAEDSGLPCNTAQTNKEVEDAFRRREIAVVLLSFSTKGFSMKRFTRFLNENPSLDDVPIIVLMTKNDFTPNVKFLYEFSEDFLIKPFDPEIMVIKIKTAIRKKNISDEMKENLRAIQDRNNKQLYEEKLGILKEITSNIANEIKDPVNFIKNFSEIALGNANSLVLSEHYNDDNDEIDTNQMAFDQLIENLNAVYKYASQLDSSLRFLLNQSNMRKGDSMKTRITGLIDNSFQLSLSRFKERLGHQQIVYETEYDLWNQKIVIDPINMQRAFELIFDNCIEAIIDVTDDALIHLVQVQTKFDSKAKKLTIKVIDNGIGIPPNVIINVFKPFFTTKPQHHGLGLATVQEVIEKSHMGQVSISSNLGKGTELTIVLPAVEKIDGEKEAKPDSEKKEPVKGGAVEEDGEEETEGETQEEENPEEETQEEENPEEEKAKEKNKEEAEPESEHEYVDAKEENPEVE